MTTGRINQVAALGFPRFNRKVIYITSQSKHEHCSNPPESSRSTDFRGFCLEPRATQTNTTNMCFRSRAANPRGPPVGPLGKSPSVPKAYLKVLAKVPGAFRKTRRHAILRPPPKLLSAGLRGVRSVLCVRFRIAYSHKPSLLAPVVPHAIKQVRTTGASLYLRTNTSYDPNPGLVGPVAALRGDRPQPAGRCCRSSAILRPLTRLKYKPVGSESETGRFAGDVASSQPFIASIARRASGAISLLLDPRAAHHVRTRRETARRPI